MPSTAGHKLSLTEVQDTTAAIIEGQDIIVAITGSTQEAKMISISIQN